MGTETAAAIQIFLFLVVVGVVFFLIRRWCRKFDNSEVWKEHKRRMELYDELERREALERWKKYPDLYRELYGEEIEEVEKKE